MFLAIYNSLGVVIIRPLVPMQEGVMSSRVLYRLIRARRNLEKRVYGAIVGRCFQSFGRNSDIDPSFYFEDPESIAIGESVQIRRGVVIIGRSKHQICKVVITLRWIQPTMRRSPIC